jgi:hypothetical protein
MFQRKKRKIILIVALTAALLLAITSMVLAAELSTAELIGTVNDVTVTKGSSASFTITVWVGNSPISNAITSENPATAKVMTSYNITGGSLSFSTLSNGLNFYAGSTGCSGNICDTIWDGYPTKYSVEANISIDNSTPVGTYTIILSSDEGTTVETNPVSSGNRLVDNTATTINVHVVAPSDSTAPTTNITLDPATPNGNNGWYTSNVHVTVSASDNAGGSGVAETRCVLDPASAPATFDDIPVGCAYTGLGADVISDGVHTVYAASKDIVGNKETPVSKSFQIDKTKPVITGSRLPLVNSFGWNNTDVVVSFSCADVLSGVDTDTVAGATLTAEGAEQSVTNTGTCTDKAGNTADSATVSGINIDKTDPTISAALDKSPAATGWFNIATGAPTVSFTCSDELSGLDDNGCPGFHLFGEGAGQSWEGTVYDKAGNSASAGVSDIDVDLTAPSISASVSPDRPASGWWNIDSGAPTVSFTCSDGTSGLDGSCPASYTFLEGENQSYSKTIYDKAGNSASAGVDNIDVDLTVPTLTWSSDKPADGGVYYFMFVPTAPECTADDDLSGPGDCSVDGWSDAIGSHTMTATAYDLAGNSFSEQRKYEVKVWTLDGFFPPVDVHGILNVVKNGSTVPLKFKIFAGTTELTNTTYVKSLTYGTMVCDVNAPTDAIETVATGGTILRYADGQFIFNWKTPSTAGKCYQVTMTTLDGSSLIAYFKLK